MLSNCAKVSVLFYVGSDTFHWIASAVVQKRASQRSKTKMPFVTFRVLFALFGASKRRRTCRQKERERERESVREVEEEKALPVDEQTQN
jgi:hypothetical protein